MADIPIPANDRYISYTAAGGETSFDFDFPVYAQTDLVVRRTRAAVTTTLTLTADYTVTIDPDGEGSIAPVASVLAADVWEIYSDIPIERATDFQQRGNWTAAAVNLELDRFTMMMQELKRQIDALSLGNPTLPLSLTSGGTGSSYADEAALFAGIKQPATATVSGAVTNAIGRGHLAGLTLSNNVSDATNDIDIAIGSAMAGDQSVEMHLTSAITKRLDAAWAVGTNQGGLDTGSIANTTYHVWLIRRSDTGVVDALFSTSATAPTMPTNYDQKRRIGSIIRASSAIRGFRQFGDIFRWASPATDRNSTSAAAAALLALTVPTGIVVQPQLNVTLAGLTSVTCNVALGDAAAGNTEVTVAQIFTGAGDSSETNQGMVAPFFSTNTSAQIYFAQTNTSGTPAQSTLITIGWIDTRGRFD